MASASVLTMAIEASQSTQLIQYSPMAKVILWLPPQNGHGLTSTLLLERDGVMALILRVVMFHSKQPLVFLVLFRNLDTRNDTAESIRHLHAGVFLSNIKN